MTDPLAALALGFGLGLRHATEPDHVAAVSTMATGAASLRDAGRIGVLWGLGHSATVLMVGMTVLALGRAVPSELARLLEGVAGAMLLGLAAWALLARRRTPHAPRGHADGPTGRAAGDARRSFLVGTMHGLAGSAAVALVLLAGGQRLGHGVAYLLTFGAGTTLGMGLLAAVLARAIAAVAARGGGTAPRRLVRRVRTASAVVSAALGAALVAGAVRG